MYVLLILSQAQLLTNSLVYEAFDSLDLNSEIESSFIVSLHKLHGNFFDNRALIHRNSCCAFVKKLKSPQCMKNIRYYTNRMHRGRHARENKDGPNQPS